jgi:hypothetical protein
MAWGLANLWKQGDEGGYAVWHGHQPVNDFGHPRTGDEVVMPTAEHQHRNYVEKAFLCLFPYGRGRPESDRPQEVLFNNHIRYALQYHDQHFRKHEMFPFIAFRISHRCQALNSARIQMRRKNFEADAQIMSTITSPWKCLNRHILRRRKPADLESRCTAASQTHSGNCRSGHGLGPITL